MKSHYKRISTIHFDGRDHSVWTTIKQFLPNNYTFSRVDLYYTKLYAIVITF